MSHLFSQFPRRLYTLLALSLTLVTLWFVVNGPETQIANASKLTSAQAMTSLEEPASRPAAQGQAEWTIMLYQDADDETLEQDILIDFNEVERVGSTEQVNIVAQVDRFDGAFDGMGDWTSTKRFYVTQDDDLNEIGSEEWEDLGEINMADGQSLVDFITWSAENFPANRYVLILSDHGMGWPGGWSDPDPGGPGPDEIFLTQLYADGLWLMELDLALEAALAQTGIEQFELIGFDACLMGQLEVFSAVAPYALYSVASQEIEPAMGWAYTAFLDELVNNPDMDGAELAQHIVETYIDQDQRIIDDLAREELLLQEFGFSGQATPAEVAEIKGQDVTLTAVDLAAIPDVNATVDNLAVTLVNLDPQVVAEARAYAQPFESVFGEEFPSPYIDLGHFMQLLVELSGDEEVAAAVDEVQTALGQAIVAEKHGPNRPGATGLAIHFPTGDLYNIAENLGYATVAGRFAGESQWDDFLLSFHAGGEPAFSRPDDTPQRANELPEGLTQEDVDVLLADIVALQDVGYLPDEIPQAMVDEFGYEPDFIQALLDIGFFNEIFSRAGSRTAAAAGPKPIELTPLTLSAEIATITAPVTISADISGDRLAYLYSFTGRFLPREDALIIEDIDYIFADETKEVAGVKYPAWPDESFSVEFDWEPTIYAVSDGQTSIRALFEPVRYDNESPTYSLGVTYRPASGGDPRFAKIYFVDDSMTEIFGFTSSITQAIGAPRQILPQPGDQFIVLEKGDDLSLEGDAGRDKYVREAGALTFNGQPFTLETTPAPSGNYVVGLIAEDLDGNQYEQYEGLFVVNEAAAAVDGFVPFVSEALGFALLYPEQWTVEENAAEGLVDFSDASGSAQVTILRSSYPGATSAAEANGQAIQEVIDTLSAVGELENLQFVTEIEDYILGAFDAQVIDFAYDFEGQPYYGYAVAATPVDGTTYVVLVSSLDADFDDLTDEFTDMLYSFDILISGMSKEQAGPPPPDFAGESFSDDFSDPAGGLVSDEAEQAWGRGYYTDAGQYLFELKPAPGAIYDYYADQTLPADFLLQATASYTGAVDNGYGLIFQVQVGEDSDEFYAFRISGDGFYTVEKTEGDELVPLIDWTASRLIDQAESAANVLTVEGRGDTYNFYINGQQVDSFTDATYNGGAFGFMVDNYDEAAPANFTFDDLKVGTPAQ